MRILTVTIGFFAWLATSWHRMWGRFHSWRMRIHSEKEDGHKAQADSLATAARTLAPPKAKVIAAPVEPEPAQIAAPVLVKDRQALAAAVKNYHPWNAPDRAGAPQEIDS